MMGKLAAILLLLATLGAAEDISYVVKTENGGYKIVEDGHQLLSSGPPPVAQSRYADKINQTGWAYLEITSNKEVDEKDQAFGSGMIEGYVTAHLIYNYWLNMFENYCTGDMEVVCTKLSSYLLQNRLWANSMIKSHPGDPYWHQVAMFYQQYEGLAEGYRTRAQVDHLPFLTNENIMLMNIQGDMNDLSQSLVHKHKLNVTIDHSGYGHCSALIKLLPGYQDLYTSQVAWSPYNSMTRVLKKYNLYFTTDGQPGSKTIPGQSMTFSSYPGVLYSADDFTIASTGLTTQETTIGNYNPDLWKYIQPTESVLEGIRATIANRLATTGQEWTTMFSEFNSGTYNNQWMVVDYKQFTPGQAPRDGTLWVLEQMPGNIYREDMTSLLLEQMYWPSYNTPHFKFMYELAGFPSMANQFGDWYTYDKTPRALIFKRDHSKVTDMASMEKLMRYNNFKEDPLSACDCSPPYSGENAIAGRSDLNPKDGVYEFPALGHRNHGGTDMKITNSQLSKDLFMLAVSSPTSDNLPAFQWSKSDFADTPHHGLPDLWNFKSEIFRWNNF